MFSESQGEDESDTSTWAVWWDRFPSTVLALLRGEGIVENENYHGDL